MFYNTSTSDWAIEKGQPIVQLIRKKTRGVKTRVAEGEKGKEDDR